MLINFWIGLTFELIWMLDLVVYTRWAIEHPRGLVGAGDGSALRLFGLRSQQLVRSGGVF